MNPVFVDWKGFLTAPDAYESRILWIEESNGTKCNTSVDLTAQETRKRDLHVPAKKKKNPVEITATDATFSILFLVPVNRFPLFNWYHATPHKMNPNHELNTALMRAKRLLKKGTASPMRNEIIQPTRTILSHIAQPFVVWLRRCIESGEKIWK